ncbi:MAG: ATP-dependent DNA helicase UvrD2 [Ilumatobacteraceae bacterium]
MPISCVYCGGRHARAADVRRCWADSTGEPVTDESAVRSVPEERHDPPASPAGVVRPRRGPTVLGRHAVVRPGSPDPVGWEGVQRRRVDAVRDPRSALDALRTAARTGTSVVVELVGTDFEPGDPIDETDGREPYEVGVGHQFLADELHHLVWSNSIDLRDPETPRWSAVDAAVRLGARIDGDGDVQLPDGTAVWLDGGPFRHVDPVGGIGVVHVVTVEHGHLAVPGANVTGAELAPDQLAAVTHAGGAARIIAPAGSGKTRVLTERARHLIRTWRLPPSAVTLVAFNKRAEEEMRRRTTDLVGLQIRTLNSIALAIVNGVRPFAAQPTQWRTVDEADVRRILGRLVETPRKLNVDPIAPWIDALGLVRLGLVDPATAEVRYGGDVDGLVDVYPKYLSALDRDRVVDFDGQIHRAIRILLTQPEARRAAQRASRVLLVDEFQDLTPAHLLLVRLLAAPAGSVFGVGDDDQTIYGYNGADPSWLIDFVSWFPTAGDHPLEVNYRCPPDVVDAVDRLLRHNRRRVPKSVRASATGAGGLVTLVDPDPVGCTRDVVVRALTEGVAPAEIAVLARVNASLAAVQVALTSSGVAVSGGVGLEFLERTAVRSTFAWLRLASGAPFDPVDVGEALRRPSRGLHPRVRDWVAEQRDVEGLRRLAGRLTSDKDAAKVEEFADTVQRLQSLARAGMPTRRLVDELVDGVGLAGAIGTLDRTRTGMNRSAQGDDLTAVAHLAGLHADSATFEDWLRTQLAVRRSEDGVVLSTVHRVKGQEWPVVVVHLADHDQFPHRLADDIEEERRIFHVAITRAARRATIVAERPSPFIAELTTEPTSVPTEQPTGRHLDGSRTDRASTGRSSRVDGYPGDHPLAAKGQVIAAPGLVLVDQGQEWSVVALDASGARAERNGAVRTFRFGTRVITAGRQRGDLTMLPAGLQPASVRVFDRLRAFRERARAGRPAYTVFTDRTLVAIADSLPTDVTALGSVPGIGPAKSEQYGDDVVDIVIDCLDA